MLTSLKRPSDVTESDFEVLVGDIVYRAFVQVVEFCNIEYHELTVPLLIMIHDIILDKIRNDALYMNDGNPEAKSIKEGDAEFSLVTSLERLRALRQTKNLLSDYYSILYKYRRLHI